MLSGIGGIADTDCFARASRNHAAVPIVEASILWGLARVKGLAMLSVIIGFACTDCFVITSSNEAAVPFVKASILWGLARIEDFTVEACAMYNVKLMRANIFVNSADFHI